VTTHRIPADKVVIEDDRRVEQTYQWEGLTNPDFIARRNPAHDYSQPHKIIYVPVEPVPEYYPSRIGRTSVFGWCWKFPNRARGIANIQDIKEFAELIKNNSPFHPDDTLILEGDNLLSYDHEYNVVKVLGVEERWPKQPKQLQRREIDTREWHWKLQGKVK